MINKQISARAEISTAAEPPCPGDAHSRIHPSLLTRGIWVGAPGEPTEEELEFFRTLPGVDDFRRRLSLLASGGVE